MQMRNERAAVSYELDKQKHVLRQMQGESNYSRYELKLLVRIVKCKNTDQLPLTLIGTTVEYIGSFDINR